ncbi:MAG: 30S ribosomal protein S20 [Polyangiaceae bacterium]
MANHKSAEKRNRQRITRTDRAKALRTRVRGAIKQARLALDEGKDDAPALVQGAQTLLDKAASKNVLPPKRANRLKSRLAKALNKAQKG